MPAALATLIRGESIIKKKQKLLQKNIDQFLQNLNNSEQFIYIDNYPAFYFSNSKLTRTLEKNGVLVTNFNYPNENSPMMSRIVLSAAHTSDDIRIISRLINTFNNINN